jgi:hypothetical protein
MDDDTRTEIHKLQRQVEALSAPLEDALAHRVFKKAQDNFWKWLIAWGAMATVIVTALGYRGYQEIVELGRREASEAVRKTAIANLQADIARELASAREQVKQTLLQNSLDTASKVDRDLAQILSETQASIDARLARFATQVGAAIKDSDLQQVVQRPTPPRIQGYAYYGSRSGDTWSSDRNFARTSGDPAGRPQTGDTVRALNPVNARSAVIRYDPIRGWVNAPTVGLIREKQTVRVTSVIPVVGAENFIWIQFESDG